MNPVSPLVYQRPVIHPGNVQSPRLWFTRQNFLPVFVRPTCTLPLACNSFKVDPVPQEMTLYPKSPPPQPDVTSASVIGGERGTTSTKDFASMFKLAAERNGIKIGEVQSENARTDSLENFKELARRNGITVCPPGSETRCKTESTSCTDVKSAAAIKVDDYSIESEYTLNSSSGRNKTLGLTNEERIDCNEDDSATSNGFTFETSSNGLNKLNNSIQQVRESAQIKFESCAVDESLLQEKCDIGSIHGGSRKESESIESQQEGNGSNCSGLEEVLSARHEVVDFDQKRVKKERKLNPDDASLQDSEDIACHVDELLNVEVQDTEFGRVQVKGIESCEKVTGTNLYSQEKSQMIYDDKEVLLSEHASIARLHEIAGHKEVQVGEMAIETNLSSHQKSREHVEDELSLQEGVWIARLNNTLQEEGIKVRDETAKTSLASLDKSQEHLENLYTSKEDEQIARFYEIAKLKDIKVCENESEKDCVPHSRTQEQTGLASEEDRQIARFTEIAKLNGIKVSGNAVEAALVPHSKTPEQMDDVFASEEDGQIARFSEIAKLNGIKVGGNTVEAALVPHSKTPEQMDDVFASEEDGQIARFSEIAKLNGIKVGGNTVEAALVPHSKTPEQMDDVFASEEDGQIARFSEIAKLNGIKVSGNGIDADLVPHGKTPEQMDDVFASEEDGQIARFFEIAKLNGIKVSGNGIDADLVPCGKTREQMDDVFASEEDGQIARFSEIAKLNGIKVSGNGIDADLVPHGKTPEQMDDVFASEEDGQIARFFEIAKLNGIKVSGNGIDADLVPCGKTREQMDDVFASEEDGQIARFSEIAKLKSVNLKVEESAANVNLSSQQKIRNQSKDSVFPFEEDRQIARFHEIAKLKGIKVNENAVNHRLESQENIDDSLALQRDSQTETFWETAKLKGSRVEGIATGNISSSQENFDVTPSLRNDMQMSLFREMALYKDIKIESDVETNVPRAISQFDNNVREVEVCMSDKVPSMEEDIFEQLARRNGIRVCKVASSAEKKQLPEMSSVCSQTCPREDQSSRDNLVFNRQRGGEALKTAAVELRQVSTQTILTNADISTQTDEERDKLKVNSAVQVNIVREAFEEEFQRWKLNDSEENDAMELSYRGLYFEEKRTREEIQESLENEKNATANTKHNHKRVVDELKQELSNQTSEIEKLTKDLKTLKKKKDSEIKRLTKELKSRHEELEAAKSTWQLKEVALENLKVLMKEQNLQLKTVKEQFQQLESTMSEAKNEEPLKVCAARRTSDPDSCVTDGKKSSKPQRRENYWEVPPNSAIPAGISGLCEFNDKIPPPCVDHTADDSHVTVKNVSSSSSLASSSVSSLASSSSASTGGVDTAAASSSFSTRQVNRTNIQPQNSAFVRGSDRVLSSVYNLTANHSCSVEFPKKDAFAVSRQQPQAFSFSSSPAQPFPVSSIQPQALNQYLSGLLTQSSIAPGRVMTSSSGTVRPPPGFNTEPVSEVGPVSTPLSGGKFSSFDKLMEALQNKFPSKNRQELIAYLKKAKAACGAAGFRGKEINDVVECVEKLVKQVKRDKEMGENS